ncbi:right-handed parallel beta-helix repeat-containing protein [Streptomyces cylindrosporus]|uniref:Right-handed parallel beta-helix repeat-containing protein n=1 Tax=Streptomyces cylindrosporus TaxID=2927583 RepID=A0ABS9Y3D7_9ACTN|nr:right-handed parallel beta-helix repeat-containing protein [Streptomyces cylindrosporus]MCI3271030.1 right-handed parallel beta-helix repeat-containing protein [Streptomyces cylindrosporus]
MDVTGGRLQYMLERLNTSSTVNVETFGAVGDGITDDTLAIQAALDLAHSSGGGLVQFTPGKTYAVSTFLVVYDYTTVYAYGATIKAIGNSGILRNFLSSETFNAYEGHSHIQILGGRWDGNAFNGTTGSVTAETDVMNFVHAQDITVRDATIENTSTAHALEFNAVDGGRALNCRFLGYNDNSSDASRQFSEAIQIDISVSGSSSIGSFDNTPAKNILVDGCYFGVSSRCGKFGRAVGSHTLASGQYYYGIQIVNNRIEGTLQEGVRGYGWRRSVIANNVISGTGYSGIWLGIPNPSTAGYTATSYDLTIQGNTITAPATDSAIRVVGYSGASIAQVTVNGNSINGGSTGNANGIQMEYCNSPVVSGNTLASVQSTGIYNVNSDSGTITGNTIRGTASNGINVSNSSGTVVSSNHVRDASTNHCIFIGASNDFLVTANRVVNAASTGAGIRLGGTATDGTVNGNRVVKGTSQNGISVDSTATGCIVANNDLSGNGWSTATALAFSATVTTSFGGGSTSPGFNRVS